ncbi:hypothetical protein QBC46DRAFT_120566 [Diplogelasinospora grovesii]|uniref:Ilp is an apoptosis inhibitor n=1 Tax=Diplogelasinospora grovesii TaxID=303347 RepID=A0AAN6S535_9PEZI|nr:hypothetical protein QBC46DRAFT_120566 [Diplogelasinospora grovesii]
MAFNRSGGPSFQQAQPFLDSQFDIFEWHPYFQSCVRYFLDHAQYNGPVQALAAFINIQLPFQKTQNPVYSTRPAGSPGGAGGPAAAGLGGGPSSRVASKMPMGQHGSGQAFSSVTLIPYIRRLVATGFDFPAVLHGFFGDDWAAGIGPLHEQERRNYLFAAKSDNWLTVKAAYDMGVEETIPFLRPLQNVSEKEILVAESSWSEWLAMQDWMLGPRAPEAQGGHPTISSPHGHGGMGHGRANIKREAD